VNNTQPLFTDALDSCATRPLAERVLVVDDDVRHLELVRGLLAPDRYDLVTAPTAEAALRSLEDGVPALILADIDLPGIDGLTFTRRVRNAPRTRRVPILVVSARWNFRDRARALAAGAGQFISKPLDTNDFPALVASIVRPECDACCALLARENSLTWNLGREVLFS
jgi:two-component system phosphate regulon response regulator PhoB